MAHKVDCPAQGCEFSVQSANMDEIAKIVQDHAVDTHGMSMDRSEIDGLSQEV